MATTLILIGSLGGFLAAACSYVLLDAHALTALAIWLLAGPISAVIVMLASQPRNLAQRRDPAQVRAG